MAALFPFLLLHESRKKEYCNYKAAIIENSYIMIADIYMGHKHISIIIKHNIIFFTVQNQENCIDYWESKSNQWPEQLRVIQQKQNKTK